MNTKLIKYSEVKIGDKIIYKEKDHERRKLNFQEIETVEKIFTYQSRGAGLLTLITYESGNQTLGIFDRLLEVINN